MSTVGLWSEPAHGSHETGRGLGTGKQESKEISESDQSSEIGRAEPQKAVRIKVKIVALMRGNRQDKGQKDPDFDEHLGCSTLLGTLTSLLMNLQDYPVKSIL